jgi:Putative Flp pilus-assembly TadE/G-like
MNALAQRRGNGERGAVLVMLAVWLPVLLLMGSFVIDVANWFVHKRHLQMQADAAALAGAGDFTLPNCSSTPIIASTKNYSGITGAQYNPQLGGTLPDKLHLAINSDSYLGASDPSSVTVGDPCTQFFIDTKLTESNLPWLLRAAKVVPAIHAHARVSILQQNTVGGALPIAVPDVNPKRVRAIFVNEDTGAELGHVDLAKDGAQGSDVIWDNVLAPLPVTINKPNIGVRVAVSGSDTNISCGQPLVQCFDATNTQHGILYIHGWSKDCSANTVCPTPSKTGGKPPLIRDVSLVPGTCADAYFSNPTASCSVGVRASVNWGANGPDPTAAGGRVTATVGRTTHTLVYNAANQDFESLATEYFSIPAASGAAPVSVDWAWVSGSYNGKNCNGGNGNSCTASFGTVQRSFTADSDSGPIHIASVSENGVTDKNSFEECSSQQTSCTHNLVVRLGLQGSLQDAQSVNDPKVALRVAGGSQNQSLDCDPALSKLKDELAQGCSPQYTINGGTPCPAGNTISALQGTPQPWNCVAVQTGNATNQVPAGLNTRILGSEMPSTCPAFGQPGHNNWLNFGTAAWNDNDPRIVGVYLTPFGTFDGSGNELVPIIDFATFYITGWTGQGSGFNNPCQGKGDDSVPNNDAGLIVGHFIKYVNSFNSGGGTVPCNPQAFAPCVAVLTE